MLTLVRQFANREAVPQLVGPPDVNADLDGVPGQLLKVVLVNLFLDPEIKANGHWGQLKPLMINDHPFLTMA